MEKLLNVRFAQAVSVGGKMETYIDASKGKYEIWLVDDFRIRITDIKSGKTVYSSLFNSSSWESDEAYNKAAMKKRVPSKRPAQDFEDRELPLSEAAN